MYKIGSEWGQKKAICNKFPTSSSVTCLTWPKDRANDIYFGLSEGKVKTGKLANNKSAVAFSTDNYVLSLASRSINISILNFIPIS